MECGVHRTLETTLSKFRSAPRDVYEIVAPMSLIKKFDMAAEKKAREIVEKRSDDETTGDELDVLVKKESRRIRNDLIELSIIRMLKHWPEKPALSPRRNRVVKVYIRSDVIGAIEEKYTGKTRLGFGFLDSETFHAHTIGEMCGIVHELNGNDEDFWKNAEGELNECIAKKFD